MSSDSASSSQKDSTSSSQEGSEKITSYIFCSFCKEGIPHAPIAIPISPIRWEIDEDAAKTGLIHKTGYVDQAKACLPCARLFLAKASLDFFLTKPTPDKNFLGPFKAGKLGFLKWLFSRYDKMICADCKKGLAVPKNTHPIICPHCGILLRKN